MGMKHSLVSAANALLHPFGAQVTALETRAEPGRFTMTGVLLNAQKAGLEATTVVDVGAATGTPPLYECFPNAHHVLIDPLRENEAPLAQLVKRLPRAECHIVAATSTAGQVTINVHPDLKGSSLFLESEESDVNGVPRSVPGRTVDEICASAKCRAPYVVKVDVQGAELEVLRGAQDVLAETEFVILEVVLFDFFDGGPRFAEIIAFMAERGFTAYDFMDPGYRPLDGAMSQIDIAFARRSGALRRRHFFATPSQRAEQTAALMPSRDCED